jgi:ferredoxin--NADP+ reductase
LWCGEIIERGNKMYKIVSKKEISSGIVSFEIYAPNVARNAKAGQFIMFRIDEQGERVPLTIAGADKEKGLVKIIFQEVGKSTKQLGALKEGDFLRDFTGPLGQPTEIKNYGTIVAVAGGVGTAEVLPVVRELKNVGNKVVVIVGARSKNLIILEDEIRENSNETYFATNDGSYGVEGFVTDVLKDILNREKIDVVYAIGPAVMMRAVSDITKEQKIKTLVSLNPIMVDASGMCGACRVSVNGETKFACVDGPEFDGHLVDWQELSSRLNLFKEYEKISLDKLNKITEEKCGCSRE